MDLLSIPTTTLPGRHITNKRGNITLLLFLLAFLLNFLFVRQLLHLRFDKADVFLFIQRDVCVLKHSLTIN